MEESAKITFVNGLVLNAMLNATTFIVDEKPDFPDDLSEVTVEMENGTTVYHNAKIMEAYSDDGKYRFGISEMSPLEIQLAEYEDAICELSKMF